MRDVDLSCIGGDIEVGDFQRQSAVEEDNPPVDAVVAAIAAYMHMPQGNVDLQSGVCPSLFLKQGDAHAVGCQNVSHRPVEPADGADVEFQRGGSSAADQIVDFDGAAVEDRVAVAGMCEAKGEGVAGVADIHLFHDDRRDPFLKMHFGVFGDGMGLDAVGTVEKLPFSIEKRNRKMVETITAGRDVGIDPRLDRRRGREEIDQGCDGVGPLRIDGEIEAVVDHEGPEPPLEIEPPVSPLALPTPVGDIVMKSAVDRQLRSGDLEGQIFGRQLFSLFVVM